MTKTHRDSITHRLTALLAAVAVFLAPVAVRAQPTDTVTEARQRFQTGKQLFDAGDYRGAIREFEAANRLAPAPLLLFNIGLAYERLGEAAPALQHFKAYLEQQPNASNRSLVEIKIARLEGELGQGQPAAGQGTVPGQGQPAVQGQGQGQGTIPGQGQPGTAPATGQQNATNAPTWQEVPRSSEPPDWARQEPAKPAPTGDPQLDRVAAIDVSWVRDQRAPLMVPAAAEPAVATEAPSKPAHKQVWFWVVVGVSALILLDIMAGGPDTAAQPGAAATGTGATLLRF
jgi:tetratricopeptide (TPR) repeat protein